jgi:transposase
MRVATARKAVVLRDARSVLQNAASKSDAVSRWAVQLAARVGYWKAIVAIAAKNARMCWAVLKRGESFKLPV